MVAFTLKARLALLAIVAAGSIGLGDIAHAASCKSMKAELASMRSGGQSKSYASAIRRQKAQIGKVKQLFRSHGCNSSRSAACTTLRASHRQMTRNLQSLKRANRKGGSSSRRRALKRRIARKCDEFSTTRTAMLKRISRKKVTKSANTRRSRDQVASAEPKRLSTRGTYKTMCVRLCDGFAFPVSLSTRPPQFGTDAASCSAMCPGTATRLYAAPARQASVERARDVETGEPYPALGTAFRHKETYDRACSCRFGQASRIDYGKPIKTNAEPEPNEPVELKPMAQARVVGPDYFANR